MFEISKHRTPGANPYLIVKTKERFYLVSNTIAVEQRSDTFLVRVVWQDVWKEGLWTISRHLFPSILYELKQLGEHDPGLVVISPGSGAWLVSSDHELLGNGEQYRFQFDIHLYRGQLYITGNAAAFTEYLSPLIGEVEYKESTVFDLNSWNCDVSGTKLRLGPIFYHHLIRFEWCE